MRVHERVEVLYSGHVQGVGFRQRTVETARDFEVVGIVRNLADGRVQLIAEGDGNELRRLLAAVDEAMTGFIRNSQVNWYPATGEYRDFRIRRDGLGG